MDLHFNGTFDGQAFGQELAVLREWDALQQSLLSFAATSSTSPTSALSRRTLIEDHIPHITAGCARLYWQSADPHKRPLQSQLIPIRYQHVSYGMLELAPGYLVSHFFPAIPQRFADLCGVLLALAEHEELVWYQCKALKPIYNLEEMKALNPRERDVLEGLALGENEGQMAQRLGLGSDTIHTHRNHLYSRLQVHNAKEALFRGFALRLLDWLDLPH